MPRTSILWLAVQLLLLAGIFLAGWWSWIEDGTPWISITGGLLMLVSLFPAIRGFVDLGKNLSPGPHPVPNNELVTRGIYSRIRHPLYSSLVLLAAGWAIFTQSWSAAAGTLVLLVFFRRKSLSEEAALKKIHPSYEAYVERTGAFLPRLRNDPQRIRWNSK
jgi:protein-S-isoprenylcysteine O-methyltransferase Ste14